jgi:HD superfamily phosphohydrolase
MPLVALLFALLMPMLHAEPQTTTEIITLYGREEVKDPLIIELLASPVMQRLKSIDQSGICHYMGRIGPYNRYEHSLGVYLLLKKFHAPFPEQVAGLLHDISHTVFSHTGDWLFYQGSHEESYQDNIQAWFLAQHDLEPMFERYGMTLKQALAKGNNYSMLEQELPDVCADRLEYNLFTGHLMGLVTREEIEMILDDIHFKEGKWFFEDPVIAAKFARLSLYFTENLWGATWNAVCNELCSRALKRALDLNIISLEEIHFATDALILQKLQAADDPIISELMHQCRHVEEYFVVCDPAVADYSCRCKFRGIDPLIRINGTYVRLTAIDANFDTYYQAVKKQIAQGVHVKFVKACSAVHSP